MKIYQYSLKAKVNKRCQLKYIFSLDLKQYPSICYLEEIHKDTDALKANVWKNTCTRIILSKKQET